MFEEPVDENLNKRKSEWAQNVREDFSNNFQLSSELDNLKLDRLLTHHRTIVKSDKKDP
jgi:hypothetical protein